MGIDAEQTVVVEVVDLACVVGVGQEAFHPGCSTTRPIPLLCV